MRRPFALVLVLATAACGPTAGSSKDADPDDPGGPDSSTPPPPPPIGSLSGTVWAPGQAPGMVPDGYEIPVSGAVVYVVDPDSSNGPDPIPDGAYCDPCQELPYGAVLTDARGRFELTGVPSGSQRLVIEKAQFRLDQTIDIPVELGRELSAEETTLPSTHDPASGRWIPHIALAIGDSDHTEDVLGKMGIVGLDASGRAIESSFADNDRVVLYGNPIDAPFPSQHAGTITDLFTDLDAMLRYHIIFVPCNYESDVSALSLPSTRDNIRAFVAAGGKLYVTDWSAEWEDAAFPDFVRFEAAHDTTGAMAAGGVINPGDGDNGHFAMHAFAADPDLAAWLDGQKAPLVVPLGGEELDFPSTYDEGIVDASDFIIEQNWNLIRELPSVSLGTDSNGDPIVEQAKEWITGDYNGADYPHTVTFEPSCGRVLYSTYHTAQQTHQWLVPQERVLLYLIMEIGVCNDGPIIE